MEAKDDADVREQAFRSYCQFSEDSGNDIEQLLALCGLGEEISHFRKFHVPVTRHQFFHCLESMPEGQRREYITRMNAGYEHAKRTWASALADSLIRRIEHGRQT